MEFLVANVGYFLELCMIQIYAELVWKQKLCFRLFSWALFVINGLILTGINCGFIPKFGVISIHILLNAYLWIRYKGSIKEKIVKTCVVFVLAWGTEMISGIIFSMVVYKVEDYELILVLVNSMSVMLSVLFTLMVKNKKNSVNEINYYIDIKSIIICLVPLIDAWLLYFIKHKFYVFNNLVIVIYMIIVFVYFGKIQKAKYELQQKEMELDINRVYGDMYSEVINNIRRKQHNYKDQIAAIYSTHKTANSMEELVEWQRKYCDMLLEDAQFDFILTSCQEPILAGFLYYKCLEALNLNVNIDCKIRINKWECAVKLYELIEILGIFFNNAFEYVTENRTVGKNIAFICLEEEQFYKISIANEIEAGFNIDFNQMFDMGYSTKGEQRGLGLARVKEICDFYGLKINITIENNETNSIKFEINFQK